MKRFVPILFTVLLTQAICVYPINAQQSSPTHEASGCVIGAIRWDAWTGGIGEASKAVQKTLGPEKWHYRLPFYAKVLGEDTVEIDGTSQGVMDREIDYAAAAGLDYWAFVTYSADDPLSLTLNRYLVSKHHKTINFCLIIECARWRDPSFVERVFHLMQEPGYQTVLDSRPLLYFGFIEDKSVAAFGGIQRLRESLDEFRARIQRADLKRPYVVIMDFDAKQGRKWADALGCDAISSYAAGWHDGQGPYALRVSKTEEFWEQCRHAGAQVVPIIMTGWDPRPRVERPVPWGNPYQSHNGQVDHCLQATPLEIAGHVRNAVNWLATHREAAVAQTAIIYAWNEFDEGGWLCPTLSEGSARLDAIRPILRPAVTRRH